jgi:hypothetical protein
MMNFLRKKKNITSFFIFFSASFLAGIIFSGVVFGISVGYKTDDSSLKPGMVAALSLDSSENSPTVEAATEEDIQKIIGVTTTVEGSSITVASSGQTVFVENGGEVKAYVSDLNGEVNQGDQLTLSPLNGILASANDNSRIILATALEDFPTIGTQSYEIDTNDGKETTNIALMRINLDTKSLVNSAEAVSSLEQLGRSVAGKEVNEVRVIVALVILLLVLFAEGGIIYGAASSSVTSLGRNPLAGRVIKRQLFQVMFVAFGVLIVGLISIYLVLWV